MHVHDNPYFSSKSFRILSAARAELCPFVLSSWAVEVNAKYFLSSRMKLKTIFTPSDSSKLSVKWSRFSLKINMYFKKLSAFVILKRDYQILSSCGNIYQIADKH